MTRRLGWTIAALWTLIVWISFTWSYFHERDAMRHSVAIAARAQFVKDVIYRRWNAEHGGVYVTMSESSPPNPYLAHVEEREIETPSGRRLTLINPAYMTRQVHELGWKAEGVRGHITSLNPIRPANAPDDWEKRALETFQEGNQEFSSVEMLDGKAQFRLMRPLITEKGCLKCHSQHGYKEDDIRGGISVAIPMTPFMAISQEKIVVIGFGHCALWLLGLAGIGLSMRRIGQHIAEHGRVEEALKESETHLQTLIRTIPDLVWLKNRQGIYLSCNSRFESFFGAKEKDIIGKTDYDFVDKDLADFFRKHDKVAMVKGKPSRNEEEVTFAHDGHREILETIKTPMYRSDGQIVGVLGLGHDITKRKQAEEELKKRTHDISERVKELDCLFGISQLVETAGISLEEILQGTVDLLPKAWQYPDITTARIILDDQEFKTKNFKKTQWCQVSDIIVHGQLSGQVAVYYLAQKPACHEGPFLKEEKLLIDTIAQRLGRITERRRGGIELRRLKEKFEDLFHNAPIMYLSLNINGIIIECNSTFLDKIGYTRDEIIGKHMTTLLTQESAASFKKAFPMLTETGKISGVERQLITKSGEIIDVQLSVSGEYDGHGKLIKTRASFEDISGLKRAEKRIHLLTRALINAHESERQMISRELHDQIAQDLATLKVGFDTLLYNLPDVAEKVRQKAAGFSEIFKNTIAAVRDLSYTLRPPLLDEMGLAEAISNFCENFSETHSLTVQFYAAGMENVKLDFETEINLYRLVQEGLNNVHKHAKATDVFVKLIAAFPNITLRIEDNGRGFDVARRLEAAPKEKRMGIQSMEERTNLLGGKMTVKSLLSKGTIISFKIPQQQDNNGAR